jgi:FkbM family methyltransferase
MRGEVVRGNGAYLRSDPAQVALEIPDCCGGVRRTQSDGGDGMANLARLILEQPMIGRTFRKLTGRILHAPDSDVPRETIGTSYGSHTILRDSLDARSVVYSFGVGEDVSFDLGLIERYGCFVHAFDPTERSIAWARGNVDHLLWKLHPVGIAAEDGKAEFTTPADNTHVSFFRATNGAAGSQDAVHLTVRSLPSIMRELSHDRIDLLKMDVEGFEYEVLQAMLETSLRPAQIAVEFHHRMYGYDAAATNEAVTALQQNGYVLFHVSDTGREYSFCTSALLSKSWRQ